MVSFVTPVANVESRKVHSFQGIAKFLSHGLTARKEDLIRIKKNRLEPASNLQIRETWARMMSASITIDKSKKKRKGKGIGMMSSLGEKGIS